MHGIVNRAIQRFLSDTYGPDFWSAVAADTSAPVEGFEVLRDYDDAVTDGVIDAASHRLGKVRSSLLEDLGLFLVSIEPVRRLLRFGGPDYREFVTSLDELPDRVRLAVPDLSFPTVRVAAGEDGAFVIDLDGAPEFADVLAGILRGMADDYGVLACVEVGARDKARASVRVALFDSAHAAGRSFHLAAATVGR